MLEKDDIKVLRGMFSELLHEGLSDFRVKMRSEMREMITENNEILRRDIRDEVHSLIRASEHRVISEITDFIGNAILPQLDDHGMRIARLEQKAV